MNGYVVEIIRSTEGRVPSGWLSETGNGFAIVTERKAAWVFPTQEDAQTAAERYHETHRGRFVKYVIRPR